MQTSQEIQIRQHVYQGFRAFARVMLILVFLMAAAACQMGGISSAAESPTASAAPTSTESASIARLIGPMPTRRMETVRP